MSPEDTRTNRGDLNHRRQAGKGEGSSPYQGDQPALPRMRQAHLSPAQKTGSAFWKKVTLVQRAVHRHAGGAGSRMQP